jgi:hypothetical protein
MNNLAEWIGLLMYFHPSLYVTVTPFTAEAIALVVESLD